MAKRVVRVEEFVDLATGEVKPFLLIDFQEKDGNFAKVRQALTKTVVEKLDYLNGAIKLLFLVLDLAIESRIFDRPVDIILTPELVKEMLGFSKATFYRYVEKLLDAGILIKLRPNIYRLNPKMVWIGTAKSYVDWLRENEFELEKSSKEVVR